MDPLVNLSAGLHMIDSPEHLAVSLVPSVALLAVGATWPLWPIGWKELPATAFGVGLSLLVLLFAVGMEYGAALDLGLLHERATLFGGLGLCYASTLLYFSRREDMNRWRLALIGVLWLVPGYHLVGFTLVLSVCGIQSAGC